MRKKILSILFAGASFILNAQLQGSPLFNIGSNNTSSQIAKSIVCSGSPIAGFTSASDTSVCLSSIINFSLVGGSISSGLSYQWQLNGANLPNDTFAILSDTATGPNTYKCIVTCLASGQSATSSPVTITINPFQDCYCNISNTNTFGTDIGNVTVGTFTNGSASPIIGNPNSNSGYANFTNLSPISLLSGIPNLIQITGITDNTFIFFTTITGKIFIDYNHDGAYDPLTELVISGTGDYNSTNSSVIGGSVLIPSSALSGITGMRVKLYENPFSSACNTLGAGETEDYLIDIQPAVACSGQTVVGTTQANDTTVCIGQIVNFSMNGSMLAASLKYQWQVNGLNIVGDTNAYLQDTISGPDTYQCIVTCTNSGLSDTSAPLSLTLNPFLGCYCNVDTTNTFGTDIGNVTTVSFSNGVASPITANATASNAYTNFTNLGPIPLLSGIPNTIQMTGITDNLLDPATILEGRIFIDYNQDGVYDPATELAITGTANYILASSSVIGGSVLIPTTALPGLTGMRVMLYEASIPDACNAPSFIDGETEDYIVDIQPPALPCSSAPTAGTVVTSDTLICSNIPVTLSAQGSTLASGITYQWQSSSAILGPYTNIGNATSFLYPTDSISNPTYFQCIVTCTNSAQSAITNPVFVDIKSFIQCYCNTGLGGYFCTPNVRNIAINTLNNPSTICNYSNASGQSYNVFPDSANLTTTVLKGVTYPLTLTTIGLAAQITAFIDYNHDGFFNNTDERIDVLSGNLNNSQTSFSIPVSIPLTADTGKTKFRIRISDFVFADACDQMVYGETEDHIIHIINGTPCSGTPIAGSAQSTDTTVCSYDSFTLSLNGAVLGSGLSYQWYANGVLIPGDTLPIVSNITQSANTTYTCVLTCNSSGFQSTSTPLMVSMGAPAICFCRPSFAVGCNADEIQSVSINGTVNNTGPACPNAPFYNFYATPIMSANPGDTTICVFEHRDVWTHFVNVWIDYNDDFTFSDSERVITNLRMPDSIVRVSTYFIAKQDTSIHKMRVLNYYAVFLLAFPNPQPCATYYYAGETEDYYINISDTVTTVTTFAESQSESRIFNLKLYPNPTTGILNYEIPPNTKKASIVVNDLLGRNLVSKSAENSKSVDLSELKNGTYNVIMILDGKSIYSKVILNK
jgi:hypothetical protein